MRGKPIAGEGELSQPEIIPSSPLSQAGTQPHPRAREKGEGGGDARKGRGQGRRTPGNGPDEEEKGHGDRIGDSDDGGTSPSRVSSGDEAKGNEDGDPSFSLSREVEPAGRAVLGSTGEEEEEEEMGMCGFEGALVAAEASQESPAPTQLQATQHAEPGGAEKEQVTAVCVAGLSGSIPCPP